MIKQLHQYQKLILNCLQQIGKDDYRKQYHPDLSPVGWHIGHCVFTETYWIREELFNLGSQQEAMKNLYMPELSAKQKRGMKLPEFDELQTWAITTQEENRNRLNAVEGSVQQHALLKEDFLWHFLIQHYAQHYETIQMILAIRAMSTAQQYQVKNILNSEMPEKRMTLIPKGEYQVGDNNNHYYDNEKPKQNIQLNTFYIAEQPVSNAEYLAFIEQGGYENKSFWSEEGWQWRSLNSIRQPFYWQQDSNSNWYQIDGKGVNDIKPNAPVIGVNYFEASAYAHWANARLPHEYEWETAAKLSAMLSIGKIWEWCINPFHPYPDFLPYPYAGYSVPYFDSKHYSLKGGSIYTRPPIKRSSFRNYYEADKRHIFAGIRLVYDK